MALNPVRPLYSASATATNGSPIITVTGNVNCSFLSSGSIVSLGTRQLVDAISGTAPDGSGNSTITLRRPWADPTTTAPLLAFMSYEGLADAVVRLRQIIDASEGSLEGAFSYLGAWDASAGDFPPAPGEGLGSQMYRISVAGTIAGRAYRVGEPIYYDQFSSQWRSFFDLASAFSTGLLAGADAAAWRTALGLGTAATATVTTSLTDTTTGRLLKVGDGGLLGLTSNVIKTDFDGVNINTFFRTNAGAANQPVNGSFNVLNMAASNVTNTQIALPWNSLIPSLWLRSQSSDGYSPWAYVFNSRNILGIVAQSGGVPTGAIIQRGSNANGEYVRFADGTQIAQRATGNLAHTANTLLETAWTYPIAFADTPLISVTVAGANATTAFDILMASYGGAGATSATLRSKVSVTQSHQIISKASGRWFI